MLLTEPLLLFFYGGIISSFLVFKTDITNATCKIHYRKLNLHEKGAREVIKIEFYAEL